MEIYSNIADEFMLLDYLRSHSQLLFRSKINKNRNYNIDILFKDVDFLQIPTRLNGIAISIEQIMHPDEKNHKIFLLSDIASQKFFIKAGACYVFHNTLDLLVSGKANNDWIDLGEQIYPENNTDTAWRDITLHNTSIITEAEIKLYEDVPPFADDRLFFFNFSNDVKSGGKISLFGGKKIGPGDTEIVEIEWFKNLQQDTIFTFGDGLVSFGEGKILKILTEDEVKESRKQLFIAAKFVWKDNKQLPENKEFTFLLAGQKVTGKVSAFYEIDHGIYELKISFDNSSFHEIKLYTQQEISIANGIADGRITQITAPPTIIFSK